MQPKFDICLMNPLRQSHNYACLCDLGLVDCNMKQTPFARDWPQIQCYHVFELCTFFLFPAVPHSNPELLEGFNVAVQIQSQSVDEVAEISIAGIKSGSFLITTTPFVGPLLTILSRGFTSDESFVKNVLEAIACFPLRLLFSFSGNSLRKQLVAIHQKYRTLQWSFLLPPRFFLHHFHPYILFFSQKLMISGKDKIVSIWRCANSIILTVCYWHSTKFWFSHDQYLYLSSSMLRSSTYDCVQILKACSSLFVTITTCTQ